MNQPPNYAMPAGGYPPPPTRTLELTVRSAKGLKNVNWRSGELRPVVVAWIDPEYRAPTGVAAPGDPNKPRWDEKLTIPVRRPVEESTVRIEIYHEAPDPSRPLVGSATLGLKEAVDSGGFGEQQLFKLRLRRPSGRPQGVIRVGARIRESDARPQRPGQYGYGGAGYYQSPQQGYPYPSYAAPYQQPAAAPAYPSQAPSFSGYSFERPGSYYDQPAPAGQYSAVPEKQRAGGRLGGMGGLAAGALAGAVGALAIGGIAHEVAEHYEEEGREEEEAAAAAAGDEWYDDNGF